MKNLIIFSIIGILLFGVLAVAGDLGIISSKIGSLLTTEQKSSAEKDLGIEGYTINKCWNDGCLWCSITIGKETKNEAISCNLEKDLNPTVLSCSTREDKINKMVETICTETTITKTKQDLIDERIAQIIKSNLPVVKTKSETDENIKGIISWNEKGGVLE